MSVLVRYTVPKPHSGILLHPPGILSEISNSLYGFPVGYFFEKSSKILLYFLI